MLSVREERAVVGGVELAMKTVIAATDEGLVLTLTLKFRSVSYEKNSRHKNQRFVPIGS